MSHERRLKAREFALEEESAAAAAAAAAGNQELEENQPVQQGGAAARPSNKSPASSLRATIKSAKSSSQVQGATKGSRTTKSSGKDRHSKVNTARGPRDRRVRLSVSTAIQFYDIQDRLGFDQPSKAIEWLLRKAKPAIDELNQQQQQQQQQQPPQQNLAVQNEGAEGSALLREDDESSRKQLEAHDYEADEPPNPGVWKLHEAAEFGRRAGTGRVSPGPEPTRANVTRDRRAVREKDKSSGSKSTTSTTSSNTASREPVFQQQQQGFGQGSSLFESLYTSPMRSSFTQLLQAPIPAAVLQGSSHSLLQNPQFLQGLYSSYGQQQQHGSSSTLQQEQQQQQQVAHPYAMQQLVQQQQHEAGASGGFLSGLRSFGTFTPVIQVPTLASLNSTSSGMLFPHHNQMNAATAATALSGTGQRHAERNLLPFATPHQAQSHQHHQFQQLLSLEAAAAAPVAYQHAAGEQEAQHFHHHQARHFQQQDFFVPRPAATAAAAAAAGALHHRRIPARIQGIDDVDGEVQQQHQQQQQQQRQQQ